MPVFASRHSRIVYKQRQRYIDGWRGLAAWSMLVQSTIIESHIAETERIVFHLYDSGRVWPYSMMPIVSDKISIKYQVSDVHLAIIIVGEGQVFFGLDYIIGKSKLCGAVGSPEVLVNISEFAKSCGLIGGWDDN